jgi:hypothetical protein
VLILTKSFTQKVTAHLKIFPQARIIFPQARIATEYLQGYAPEGESPEINAFVTTTGLGGGPPSAAATSSVISSKYTSISHLEKKNYFHLNYIV